jgi:hypothetical protein
MLNYIRVISRLAWVPLVLVLFLPGGLLGAETSKHVVTPAELRKELADAAATRRANLEQVQDFFKSEPARKALKTAGTDPVKVERAVASLADDELARLARRTEQIEEDFAAGALSNLHLTYIVIALAAAVLVLVLK